MKRQKRLTNTETFEKYKKSTRREKFLAPVEQAVSMKGTLPHSRSLGKRTPSRRVGTNVSPPFPAERFSPRRQARRKSPLRYGESMRRFARTGLGNKLVPDEAAIRTFRHLLEDHASEKNFAGSQFPSSGSGTAAFRKGHHGRHHHRRSILNEKQREEEGS